MIRLSFYKLVQFLKTYVSPKRIETPTVIYSCTAEKWLSKLGYEYKNIRKDVFVGGHKRVDVV